MSKFSKITSYTFITISLAASTAYYMYETNEKFKYYIDDIIGLSKEGYNEGDSEQHIELQEKKKEKKTKIIIPKTVKPDKYYLLDEYAKKTPKQYEKDINTLSEYLIKPANSEIEKARVLFTWVATHIKYDDQAFNSGNYPEYSAENVLASKKAVCEGYSNILKALCEAAGLEAEKIIGYAKGYGYSAGDKFSETDHAWNAIKIDNKWRLVDATWASGFGTNKNGKLVSISKFDSFWFTPNTYACIFTHLPQDSKWQLIDKKITLSQYENLPYLNSTFFKLGFNPYNAYIEATSGKVKKFVETYPSDFPITIVQLPYASSLPANKETTLKIQSDYAEEVVLIDGKEWHHFKKTDNIFTLSHIPTNKNIDIAVKINSFDKSYSTLLKYNIETNQIN